MIVDTVNGKAMIAVLTKKNGISVTAWTRKIIEQNLKLKNASTGTKTVYIMTIGERIAAKTKRKYYGFKIRVK